MTRLTILVLSILLALPAYAAETCSRVATINYQEVLVDVSSKNLGEGLRYYLEKDDVSKSLLNEYQENNLPTWKSAALSTLGTAMIVASLLRTSSGSNELTSRNFLLFGGASMIGISYLISKTNQYNNEYLLLKSIDEYNKRNSPKIFFSPVDPQNKLGFGIGVGQEF